MRFEIKGESVFATTGGRDFDPAKPVLIFLHGADSIKVSGINNRVILPTETIPCLLLIFREMDVPRKGAC